LGCPKIVKPTRIGPSRLLLQAARDLKTGRVKALVGSNPTPSTSEAILSETVVRSGWHSVVAEMDPGRATEEKHLSRENPVTTNCKRSARRVESRCDR
jgi:hypothetical protein